jgi:hypothetical protein
MRGPQWVLIQEFGNFTNQIMTLNAQHLGFEDVPTSFSDFGWENNLSSVLLNRMDRDPFVFPKRVY